MREYAAVLVDKDTVQLKFKNEKLSLFKEPVLDSKMYTVRKGKSFELRREDDTLILAQHWSGPTSRFFVSKMYDNRYVLRMNPNKVHMLDASGKVLKRFEIEGLDKPPPYGGKDVSTQQQNFNLIGRRYLKVFESQPYLLDMENLKEFRER